MATKTFPITACLPVIYSGGSGVNPGDLHLPIGEWAPGLTGWNTRALLKAAVSFAGMTSINSARLYLYSHTASGWHAKGSGTVGMDTRRKTSDWSEASGGSSTATDEVWGGSSGTLVSGGYADDGDATVNMNPDTADGTLILITITKIVQAWFAGSPNYGLMLYATGSLSADAAEFYSRRASGKVPYIWIDYETNTAPTAPSGLTPTGSVVVHTGRTITYSGTRNDPDGSADGMTAGEIQVWNDGHTILVQSWTWTQSGGLTFSQTKTLPSGYDADRYYEWRARTRDEAGVWGPWGAYSRFRPNTVPYQMAGPTVEVDTLTPTITGTFGDADPTGPGSTPAATQIEVELAASPNTSKWDSGDVAISGSPWSVVYGGSVLAWATAYRARFRNKDGYGAYGGWSPWTTWTTAQPPGPDNLTPRTTAAKQNTLTPTLTIGHSATFRNDEVEVYAANSLSATRLWSKTWDGADYAAVTSKARVYAGTALAWGATYYWRARVELADGTIGSWSALVPFYVNADPSTPTQLSARNVSGGATVVSGGVAIVTVARPVLTAEYGDPDLASYNDRPSERSIEVYARNADGTPGALIASNTLASPPYTVPMEYALGVDLTLGSSYLHRWRFKDNAGRLSPWSAYGTVRRSAAPTVTATAPGAGAVVTDQTATLGWTYASTVGKPQAAYRVEVYDRGAASAPDAADGGLLYDSGVLAGAVSTLTLPAGVLDNSKAYRWGVTVYDADGLAGVLV